MAKLTLSFKERKLKVVALHPGNYRIGSDAGCDLVIDSLAIQPQHATIQTDDSGSRVEPCNSDSSVTVNGEALTEAQPLAEGDIIGVGKHSLTFSSESEGTVIQDNVSPLPTAGWLQIQSGSHLGRTIRLDKAFTRIGKPDAELAVIAHRDDGYFLSALQGEQGPRVNNESISDTGQRLNSDDVITVGELQVQFFTDGQSARDADAPDSGSGAQRRFSRIPFDVPATLKDNEQSWETGLRDISLHGALIGIPDAFSANESGHYQLAVHLEGGPDIIMDVEIAHQEAREIGLNCLDIDVDSITHLRRLVELNLGDPGLLERELSALG